MRCGTPTSSRAAPTCSATAASPPAARPAPRSILGGFPSIVVGNPHLLLRRQDGALVIVVPGNDDQARNVTFALTSVDGGTTWSAPAIVGVGQYDIDQAALTPDGGAVDTLENFVRHMSWQRVPIAGPPEQRIVSLTAEPDGRDTSFVFSGNLAYLPDGRPMLVAQSPDVGAGIRYRVLRAGADPYLNASWTPWSAAPALRGISVVSAMGPNGIWAMTHDSVLAGQGLKVWRFDGRRFARPRSLGTIGGPATTNALGDTPVAGGAYAFVQDAGGRLHGAWSRPGSAARAASACSTAATSRAASGRRSSTRSRWAWTSRGSSRWRPTRAAAAGWCGARASAARRASPRRWRRRRGAAGSARAGSGARAASRCPPITPASRPAGASCTALWSAGAGAACASSRCASPSTAAGSRAPTTARPTASSTGCPSPPARATSPRRA